MERKRLEQAQLHLQYNSHSRIYVSLFHLLTSRKQPSDGSSGMLLHTNVLVLRYQLFTSLAPTNHGHSLAIAHHFFTERSPTQMQLRMQPLPMIMSLLLTSGIMSTTNIIVPRPFSPHRNLHPRITHRPGISKVSELSSEAKRTL